MKKWINNYTLLGLLIVCVIGFSFVILKMNSKINNLAQVTQGDRDILEETKENVERLRADRSKEIGRVQNAEGKTFITCNTGQGSKEYTIYQLPMTDNEGGACYAIKMPNGKLIMVDSGYDSDGAAVEAFIAEHGGVVAAWFITHPHIDHVGGFLNIINNSNSVVKVERVYYNPFTAEFFETEEKGKDLEVINYAVLFKEFEEIRGKRQDIEFIPLHKGDSFKIEEIAFVCMNSFEPTLYDVNGNSMVLHMEVNGISVLFTGDITDDSIAAMCRELGEDNLLWQVDFLQIPHHGYMAGIHNDKLYELTEPIAAFIDCSRKEYEENAVDIKTHLSMLEEKNVPVIKRFEGMNEILIK